MNHLMKLTTLLLCALFSSAAFAITNAQVFAYAEANYSSLFKGTPAPGQINYQNKQFDYRFYPSSGNYLAVDTSNTIYILGPYTNNVLTSVGPVSAFAGLIADWEAQQAKSGGTSTAMACNSATTPAGINYSQSGNTVTVTTNGCVVLPAAGICNPTSPQATGINVLLTQNTQSFSLSGLTINIPGMPANAFDSQLSSAIGNAKSCIRNAPTGFSSLVINSNVCFDITQQPGLSMLAGTPGITMSSPVTLSLKGSTTLQTVPDCTTSGATSISDAYTGKVLIKQANGTYQ